MINDDIEYKGIRDIGNSFNLSIDEDYYKPIRTIRVFDNKINYIDIKVKEKDKILSVKYLDMIRPYLSDIINDHKTEEKWKVPSGNTVTDYKTQGEQKIHLSMAINFMSSKESDEIRICMQQVITQKL